MAGQVAARSRHSRNPGPWRLRAFAPMVQARVISMAARYRERGTGSILSTDQTSRRGVLIAGDAFESLDFAFREQATSDFGIDAHVEPRRGAVGTGQLLALQIKSGPSYFKRATPDGWWLETDQKHADYWLGHALPVVVVAVDVESRQAYWRAVTPDTVVSTGKGRKIFIPRNQRVEAASRRILLDMLTPVVSPGRYTIFRHEDVSHATAKRYSLDIVLKGTLSKADAACVVRAATAEARQSSYHRNELTSARWSGVPADVVWTFVYPSADDRAQANWYCRSIWIREDLGAADRPFSFQGENVGNDVLVDWKDTYGPTAEFLASRSADKHSYLVAVRPMVDRFEQLLGRHGGHLDQLVRGDVTLAAFLHQTSSDRRAITDLYQASTDLPLAPFECEVVDTKLAEFAAHMDNMVLPHSPRGPANRSGPNEQWNAQRARNDALKALGHLRYELSKVR